MEHLEHTVGVVVGTYGDVGVWGERAQNAMRSVDRQSRRPDASIWLHAQTLQHARNWGAIKIGTDLDYLIFLDADDELDENYVEEMLESASRSLVRSDRKRFIHRPSTLGVVDGVEDDHPVMIPERDIRRSNFIVIGAMVPADVFFLLDGFNDYPILEDWDLWQRMILANVGVLDAEKAVYRVNVREGSRNQDTVKHREVYKQIVDAHSGDWSRAVKDSWKVCR